MSIHRHCPVWGERSLSYMFIRRHGEMATATSHVKKRNTGFWELERAVRLHQRGKQGPLRSGICPDVWKVNRSWESRRARKTVPGRRNSIYKGPLAWGSLASVRDLENTLGLEQSMENVGWECRQEDSWWQFQWGNNFLSPACSIIAHSSTEPCHY